MNWAVLCLAQAQLAGGLRLQHQHHALGQPQPLAFPIAAEGQGHLGVVLIEANCQPCHTVFAGNLHAAALLSCCSWCSC